ncbi:LysR family transcriptional regulator, partial [Longicatena sp. 210702-DFI.1.213]|nr:LysR family transcriptional regulator [Longicatena sp. 210702-DFI.1.213]
FVLDIIKKLSDEQPNIKYHLFSGDAQDIGDRLDNGLLVFGLLIEPIDLDKYNRIQLPIHELWGLLVRKDDPLASKKY